ncbi:MULTISPECIES: HvfX family Cu-binding RiPP maturation protein [unclassified Vibrio]|uniref:HvfX family Cu-binding RiPP maturation protein n=1 Tax=unclassified Vibrio TaxID=2614977 RepID=UPI0014823C29|nr:MULTISPECIES: DoxX family protein [unclassified Vibrio]MDQ2190911.1 DoxX family protein [Vibrio sp. A14(2019)]MDQ2196665.1 DoxX family protein [Vibrio sp. 2017_1457_11]NNN75882.1 DoxX family protein [Vibrio sp. B7]NNN92575.1 DoxX family protein [Vibrio sp. B8-1]NNO07972.1 DoxX family protein [Vibrio sp. B4-12]
MIHSALNWYDGVIEKFKKFDFIVLLAIRLFLVPVIFVGAHSKVVGFAGTVAWFGASTADGGLNLPFPELLAFLAAATEVLGCICIALGLFTRIMAIPMIFMMSVASAMVHWKHGWDAIATSSMEATVRLNGFIEWLAVNFPGRYNYITELGDPVMLNNGMEFAATYFVMLMVLFIYGGGSYVSLDYWLKKPFTRTPQTA